jgi:signal transduction histidine kinase
VKTRVRTDSLFDISHVIASAIGYFAMCCLGLSLGVSAGVGSVWPASGLLTGLLLISPQARWVGVGVGAFAGGVAANLWAGFDPAASMGYVLINLAESFFANWLVRRYAPDASRLRQPSDLFALVTYCVLAAVSAGAPIAATLAVLTSDADFLTVLRTWWAADASGVIVIAPLVLVAGRYDRSDTTWSRRRVIEACAMTAAVATASWWIFIMADGAARDTLTLPLPLMVLIVWPAIRFGVTGAAWTMAMMSGFCVWGTNLGLGPYATDDMVLAHLSVQMFVCMVSIASLSLATAVESARRSALLHRELAIKLQSAADTERARLSHELHDDIAQKLAALKMKLELDQLAGTEQEASADDPVTDLEALIADVRALSQSLRPAPFEEGQLLSALAALARTEGRRAGLHVVVDTPGGDVPLSREAELACYRVVREAVTNIVKHACAHHLALSALRHAHFISVRVVDDGKGFDVRPAARRAVLDGHLGLVGMQERLDQVGGTLKIRSRRGGGTMVECRIPLVAI